MAAGDLALQILITALDQASPVIASVAASLDTLAPSVAAVNTAMASAGASLGNVAASTDIATKATQSLADTLPLADQATQVLAGSTSSLAAVFGEDYAALNATAGAVEPVVSSMGDMTGATIAAQAGFGEMSGSMEAAMAGFGGVGVDATLASVGMEDAAASATNAAIETGKAGEASRASGYQMMMYAAIVSMAAGAFIGLGMQAQSQMAIVAGLTSASSAQMAQYTAGVEDASTTFGQTMGVEAQGLYQVVSAGFKGAGAITVLDDATMAAVASGSQEASVASALTSSLNAYGASAKQAGAYTDIMTTAVTYGKQTYQEFASAIGVGAVTGAALGVSFKQVAAAEATLTDSGLTAHRAIMDLDFTMRAVMSSTDKVAQTAGGLGLSFNKTAFAGMDFYQRLQYLHQIAGGNEADFIKLVGGANGFLAAQILLANHGKIYNDILDKMGKNAGVTASAFQKAEQTMSAAGDHLKAVLSVLSYQFVQMISPAVIPIIHTITDALTALSKNAELARVVLFTLAGIVSGILMAALISLVGFFIEAIGPMGLLMITLGGLRGLLAAFAPQIIDFFQKNQWALALLVIALGAFSAAIAVFVAQSIPRLIISFLNLGAVLANWVAGVLIGNVLVEGSFMETAAAIIASMLPVAATVWAALWPILAIGAAIAAVIVIFKVLYDRWQPFHNLVDATVAGLRNLWDWLVNKVGAGFSALGTWIHGTVVPAFQAFWKWLSNIGALFSALGTFANAAKGPVGNFFSWLGGLIHLYIMAWGMIFSGIGTALNAAKGPVGNFFSWLGTGAHTAATVMGNIFSALGTAVNAVKPLFSFVGQEFSALGKTVQGALKDVQSGPLAGLGKAFGDLGKALSGLGPAWQGLKSALQPVQAEFSALWKTIQPILAQLGPQAGLFFKSIGDAAKQLGPQFQGLWNAIAQAVKTVGDALKGAWILIQPFIQQLGGALKGLWNALSGVGPDLGPIFAQLGDALKGAWILIQPVLAQLGPFLAQLGVQARNLWNSIGPTLLPGLKLLAGIIGGVLVVALGLAISALAGFLTIIVGVITGIVRIVTGIVIFFTGLITAISGVISFIIDLVTGHFDKLGADLGQIWNGIKTMALGLWTAIQGGWQATIGAILSGIGAFIHTVIQFFTNLYNTLVGHSIIPDMVNAIVNWFTTLVAHVIALVTGWVHMVINKFMELRSQALAHIQAMWNSIVGFISSYIAHIIAMIVGWVFFVINKFNELKSQATNAIQTMVNTITGIIGGLISNAFSWGVNLIQGFINGIGSMVGNVGSAIQNIANTVASFLPHSPAEKGPLSKLHTFMPGMIDTLTKGIYEGVPQMERAMTALVKPISANANGSFSLSTAHSQSFALSGNQPIVVQVQPVAASINLDGKKVGKSTLNYAAREVRIQGNYKNG